MALRIRQIVFAARDLQATVAEFERELGLEVAYRDPEVVKFGLENVVMPLDDQFFEIVSPIRADTAAGRHLDRHGDSVYMLILQTDDLVRDRARLERLGVRIIWQSQHPDMSSIQLHPKDVGAAIVSLDQAIPAESWRWAGPQWQRHRAVNGPRILAITVSTTEPSAMAHRWHRVLGTEPPMEARDAARIEIDGGTLNFVVSEGPADRITVVTLARSSPSRTLCGTRFRLADSRA